MRKCITPLLSEKKLPCDSIEVLNLNMLKVIRISCSENKGYCVMTSMWSGSAPISNAISAKFSKFGFSLAWYTRISCFAYDGVLLGDGNTYFIISH